MYNLIIAPRAQRRLKEIKKLYRQEVKEAIEELRLDPFMGKPLIEDLTRKYSYRIHVYRVIYLINIKDKIVYILSFFLLSIGRLLIINKTCATIAA